jgi:hypothetical protein
MSARFTNRVQKLSSTWLAILNERHEARSSLEEIQEKIGLALETLNRSRPSIPQIKKSCQQALRLALSEEFRLLDRKSLESLNALTVYLDRLLLHQNAVKCSVANKISPLANSSAKVNSKCYKFGNVLKRDRIGTLASELARSLVLSNDDIKRIRQKVLKINSRLEGITHRFVQYKAIKLKNYLAGARINYEQLVSTSRDIVSELRSLYYSKQDIIRMLEILEHEPWSEAKRIHTFIASINGRTNDRYTFFIPVTNLDIKFQELTLNGIMFCRASGLSLHEFHMTDSDRAGIDKFMNEHINDVICKITVQGSAHDQTERVAFERLERTLDLMRCRETYSKIIPPRETTIVSYLVANRKGRISLNWHLDASTKLPYKIDAEEKKRLTSLSKKLAADTTQHNAPLKDCILRSLHWVGRASTARSPQEAFVELVIALECILVKGIEESHKEQIIAQKGIQMARILKQYHQEYRRQLKRLYQLRSQIVHGGLSYSKSFDHDIRVLRFLAAACVHHAIQALGSGCKTIDEMRRWQEQRIAGDRERCLRNSVLSPGRSVVFKGKILTESKKVIATVEGKLSLVDEGEGGFAYHELSVSSIDYRRVSISSEDEFYFEGFAAGKKVSLRNITIIGGGDLFFLFGQRNRKFRLRAFRVTLR